MSRLYLGVDVGGTKVQASLVDESGAVLRRERASSPRSGGPERVVATIEQVMQTVLDKNKEDRERLAAIGVAVPGVVDSKAGRVVFTPNLNLTGVSIGAHLETHFHVPVAVGNDCNLGALGEKWLGSARDASSVVAILVGTGIGGGFVRKGKLWRGARESAGELGHMIMQIHGPECGCGNFGCLEALASRSAIERDIRAGLAAGRESILPALCDGDLSIIRSGAIRKALEADDALVTEIVRHAAEVLGYACLTVRHLIDPEVIVFGGGVITACSDFMLPIIENIVGSDKLPGTHEGGQVLLSALGDDAVVIGAVALARTHIGRNPFKRQYAVRTRYPRVSLTGSGELAVGEERFNRDIFISVHGTAKKRKKSLARELYGDAHVIGPRELEAVCAGGPEVLVIGTGSQNSADLTDDGRRFLAQRSIRFELLPTPAAIDYYNRCEQRKAALLRVS